MIQLVRSEITKFVSVRSNLVVAAVAASYGALAVGVAALGAGSQQPELERDTLLQIARGVIDLAAPAALVLGILGGAGEYRHGTVVPSLLASPRRQRFVAAKIAFHAGAGAVIGAAGSTLAVVAGAAYLRSEGAALSPLADTALTVAAVTAVTAAYGALGGALGLAVRNQTAAVAAALAWLLAIEEAVPIVLRAPGLRRWLLDGAATRVLHVADAGAGALPLGVAVAVIAGALAALSLSAVLRTVRSDIP